MFGVLLRLFSPALGVVVLTLEVGFISQLVVIDFTDLGATIVVALVFCLTIFNLSQTGSQGQDTETCL